MLRKEFEKFAASIRPALVRRAAAICGSDELAEDLTQDCLMKLWTIREKIDSYSNPEALAMTIIYRMALNDLRGRHQTVEISNDLMPGCESSPEELIVIAEDNSTADRIIAQLPDAQRAIITMRHIDGLDNSEIAAIVGSSEGAVRTALCRARRHIAEIFAEIDK